MTSDPMRDQRWAALAKKVEPPWEPGRAHLARAGIAQRAARRRTSLLIAGSVTTVVLIALGTRAWVMRASPSRNAIATVAAGPRPTLPPIAPAVTVTRLSPETVLEPLPEQRRRGFFLRSGGARFHVPHEANLPFVVVAGDVVVEDLGTTFTVQHLSADRVSIAVEEGRVRVLANGTSREVAEGHRIEVEMGPRKKGTPSSWRPLARRGRYDEALAALKQAGPNAVHDETGDLLLAADAARLSGNPAEAVPYLERIGRAHSRDPRASLAAFTLGRVLLDELDRPTEAAAAFARARASGGPLSEDALAREVEAASRAGDGTRSRELARQYQSTYPNGRRAKAVSRFGGLD